MKVLIPSGQLFIFWDIDDNDAVMRHSNQNYWQENYPMVFFSKFNIQLNKYTADNAKCLKGKSV